MHHEYTLSDEYADLAAEVIRERDDLHWISEESVRIGYLVSTALKTSHGRPVLGDCYKVPDRCRLFVPYDFLITLYAKNINGLPLDRMRLLLYHELLHVGMDKAADGPRYFIAPPMTSRTSGPSRMRTELDGRGVRRIKRRKDNGVFHTESAR